MPEYTLLDVFGKACFYSVNSAHVDSVDPELSDLFVACTCGALESTLK